MLAARRGDALKELAEQIGQSGREAIPVTADVSNPDDIDRIAETAMSHFGRIDIWINNAGIGALGYFWDIPIRDLARVVEVNLTALCTGRTLR